MKRVEYTQIIEESQKLAIEEIQKLLKAHSINLETTLSDCLANDKINIENALKAHREALRKALRAELTAKIWIKILNFKIHLGLGALLSLSLIYITILTIIIILK
ncbi:hypothetical protein PR729_06275 [Providencia rettgeri]|nr:hypothetical protein PR729_06275 [Providencia rettgeri]